jgi:hypothetical protein
MKPVASFCADCDEGGTSLSMMGSESERLTAK